MKEEFFNRIVGKDYNNQLEEILSHKRFSLDVKNTLLSMFYKIENGYKDYNTIKRDTYGQKEYVRKISKIIQKDCQEIQFITNANQEKEIVDKKNKKIVCYPIETKILYALAKIQKRNVVVNFWDETIEKTFSFLLNTGNNINIVEPLRDFNGFSWNVIVKDIEDINCNLLYQNIIYLVGNKFVDKWVNNYDSLVDYFDLFQSKLEKRYGKQVAKKILHNLIKISILIMINYDKELKQQIENQQEQLSELYKSIQNKEQYLIEIAKIKKQTEKEIKKIDKTMNDKSLLIQEYELRNKNLPLEKKIFSIRVLKNKLKEERKILLEKIKEQNELMNPKNFLKNRTIVKEKIDYFTLPEDDKIKDEIKKYMIELQKEIISCMYLRVNKIETKGELIEEIYQYRYYSLLPFNNKQCIYEIKELEKHLQKLSRMLIDKAIKMKVICKIFTKEDFNYEITNKLLLSKIISLEDIYVKIQNEDNEMTLNIFDENIEDFKIKLNKINKDDINIRINRKTRLFS